MSDRERTGTAQPRGKVRERAGFEVIVDKASLPYLSGATIDFVDTLQAQGFVIDNPNAKGSCACGDSFH